MLHCIGPLWCTCPSMRLSAFIKSSVVVIRLCCQPHQALIHYPISKRAPETCHQRPFGSLRGVFSLLSPSPSLYHLFISLALALVLVSWCKGARKELWLSSQRLEQTQHGAFGKVPYVTNKSAAASRIATGVLNCQ